MLPPGSKPEPPKNRTSENVTPAGPPPGVPTVIPLGATVGPPAAAGPPAPPNSLPQLSAQSLDSSSDSNFPNPQPFKLAGFNDDKNNQALQALQKPVQVTDLPPAVQKPLQISDFPPAVQKPAHNNDLPPAPLLPSQSVFDSILSPVVLVDVCDSQKRNQVRRCLQPLFARWVQLQSVRQLSNLTFPMYHYERTELLELCDHYASAFLICPFSVFQECLRDEVVFLANSVLGYICSPQNVVVFMKHYDCIAQVVRERPFCEKFISGPLLLGVDIG